MDDNAPLLPNPSTATPTRALTPPQLGTATLPGPVASTTQFAAPKLPDATVSTPLIPPTHAPSLASTGSVTPSLPAAGALPAPTVVSPNASPNPGIGSPALVPPALASSIHEKLDTPTPPAAALTAIVAVGAASTPVPALPATFGGASPTAPTSIPQGPPSVWAQTAATDFAQAPVSLDFSPAMPTAKKSRVSLMVLVALIVVAAIGIGGMLTMRSGGDDRLTDDSIEVVADPQPDESADYSFSAAAANAQQAASMHIDVVTTSTAHGDSTLSVDIDRASRRMKVEFRLSEFWSGEDGVDATEVDQDEMATAIVDESTDTMYLTSNIYGSFLSTDKAWIGITEAYDDEDGNSINEILADPLDVMTLFGDITPIDMGRDTIDDEELRHFQFPVTAAEALAEDELYFEDLFETGESIEPTDLVYDVWVTKENEVRRIALDTAADDGGVLTFVMTITASIDAIDIALPDPTDVVSDDELAAQMQDEIATIEADIEATEADIALLEEATDDQPVDDQAPIVTDSVIATDLPVDGGTPVSTLPVEPVPTIGG
jgi:hypothetical protein